MHNRKKTSSRILYLFTTGSQHVDHTSYLAPLLFFKNCAVRLKQSYPHIPQTHLPTPSSPTARDFYWKRKIFLASHWMDYRFHQSLCSFRFCIKLQMKSIFIKEIPDPQCYLYHCRRSAINCRKAFQILDINYVRSLLVLNLFLNVTLLHLTPCVLLVFKTALCSTSIIFPNEDFTPNDSMY